MKKAQENDERTMWKRKCERRKKKDKRIKRRGCLKGGQNGDNLLSGLKPTLDSQPKGKIKDVK